MLLGIILEDRRRLQFGGFIDLSFFLSYIHPFLYSSSKNLLGLLARDWRHKANKALFTIYQTHTRSFNLGGAKDMYTPRVFMVLTNL